MVNTPQKNLKNANSEQVANTVINDMKSMPNSNLVFGEIVNLLYLESSNNLAGVAIRSNIAENVVVLAKDKELSPEAETIEINNLNDFQAKLEEAFNYQSFVSISYERDRIVAVVRILPEQEAVSESVGVLASKVDPFIKSIARPSCCTFPPCPPHVLICPSRR